jgi:ribonucleoside-diphosphate reductase alpha chain
VKWRNKEEEKQMKAILGGKITNLPFSINALQVISKRYLLHDHRGEILESPEEMFVRVAKTLAQVEIQYGASSTEVRQLQEDFYQIMARFEFTPAGKGASFLEVTAFKVEHLRMLVALRDWSPIALCCTSKILWSPYLKH